MPYPLAEIIENALRGIAAAQKDYARWSGDCWLWEAPEYLITTYVARALARHTANPYYITLESKVGDVIEEAGGIGPGRRPKALNLNGKFDLLIWWGNGKPRAPVEIKRHVRGFADIRDDVKELCTVLRKNKNIKFGLLAYYTSCAKDDESRTFLRDRLQNIEHGASEHCTNNGMTAYQRSLRIKVIGDSAWTASVLVVCRK